MMVENHALLSPHMQIIHKSDPVYYALVLACIRMAKNEHDTSDLISDLATAMAQTITQDIALASHEDILGPLPSNYRYDPLYGMSAQFLAIIQSGVRDAGHDIQFVFYVRRFNDWLHSLYRYRFRDQPDRPFAPQQYKRRKNLPDNWLTLRAQLEQALGADNITFINYETDRATGRFGTALFKTCGLSNANLDTLNWIAPVNVSQPKTVDPDHW